MHQVHGVNIFSRVRGRPKQRERVRDSNDCLQVQGTRKVQGMRRLLQTVLLSLFGVVAGYCHFIY